MKQRQSVVVEEEQAFEINLGEQSFGSNLNDMTVNMGGESYEVPINKELLPITINDEFYNAHLRYSDEGVELTVVKNAERRSDDHDGIATMDVTGIDEEHGFLAVLYLIGVLRKV